MSAPEDKFLDVKLLGHKIYAAFVILTGVANLSSSLVVPIYNPSPNGMHISILSLFYLNLNIEWKKKWWMSEWFLHRETVGALHINSVFLTGSNISLNPPFI